MKRIISVFLTVVTILSVFTLTSCNNQKPKNEKITVAMELAYPPFETKDNDGNPTGVSVDIAKAFGEYLGKDVEIVNTVWDGLITSLQTGKADMVISSMTITDSRKEEVDFSNPYANAFLAILANKQSNIETINDLNKEGVKVAVKTGSTGFIYAQENLPNAQIITLADESACVTEVSQGKADAFLYDQLTIYRNQKINSQTTKAIFIPFQDVENWGVAFKKGNSELVEQFNQFLIDFRNNGGFDDVTQKYLAGEKKAFDELSFKWFFEIDIEFE